MWKSAASTLPPPGCAADERIQEDDKLRAAKGAGGQTTGGLQELLPFAASAQSRRRLAALDQERQDMFKVRVVRGLLTRPNV